MSAEETSSDFFASANKFSSSPILQGPWHCVLRLDCLELAEYGGEMFYNSNEGREELSKTCPTKDWSLPLSHRTCAVSATFGSRRTHFRQLVNGAAA